MRDFQRSRLYAWENKLDGWPATSGDAAAPLLGLDECRALVRRATARYGVAMPRVGDGRGSRRARATARWIKLPRWSRVPQVILHETAHTILEVRGRNDHHGPQFVRLFIQLLATYLDFDEATLTASARAAGLKVAGRQLVRL